MTNRGSIPDKNDKGGNIVRCTQTKGVGQFLIIMFCTQIKPMDLTKTDILLLMIMGIHVVMMTAKNILIFRT